MAVEELPEPDPKNIPEPTDKELDAVSQKLKREVPERPPLDPSVQELSDALKSVAVREGEEFEVDLSEKPDYEIADRCRKEGWKVACMVTDDSQLGMVDFFRKELAKKNAKIKIIDRGGRLLIFEPIEPGQLPR